MQLLCNLSHMYQLQFDLLVSPNLSGAVTGSRIEEQNLYRLYSNIISQPYIIQSESSICTM